MTRDFDELVGDVPAEERARLRRTHELLLAAGPPPELPPSLEQPPARPGRSEIAYFPRRRWAAAAVAAAAVAAIAFGGGYLAGHGGGGGGEFASPRIVNMHRTGAAPAGAQASLKLGRRDAAGNWPMLVNVSNLRKLPKGGYYVLYLTRNGKPVAPCGSFVVAGDRTSLHFTEPYELARFNGWVVTEQAPGLHEPGRPVLTT